MKNSTPRTWNLTDALISSLVFLLLLAGVYALLSVAPYMGFYLHPSNGEVIDLYVDSDDGLQMGDLVKQIGQVTWDDYKRNKYQLFFEDARPGQVYEIMIERQGKKILLSWSVPGFNMGEFEARFFSTWWLAFFIWFFGFLTHRYIRPRDLTWRLLTAFNYLTALFIMLGNFSAFHILGSLALMQAVVWLMVPVFLHLHWIFPTPLRNLPAWAWNAGYIFFGALAVLEIFPFRSILPYFLGLLLAFLGGLALLVVHYLRKPEGRSDIRLLGTVLFFALSPVIFVSLASLGKDMPASAPLSLFPLALLPGTYVYAINRRRMGHLELRASRAISTMAYLFLLVAISPFVMLYISDAQSILLESKAATFLFISLFVAILTIYFFPRFQAAAEQHVLGITLSHRKILEAYSTSIASSATQDDLLLILEKDIFNSLQVQQYAFIWKGDADYVILLSKNVTEDQAWVDEALSLLEPGRPYRLIPPSTGDAPLDWVRLILPLKVKTDLIGVWLLGRRDPDDLYPQADLPTIQSLASQTAIALSNIMKTENLRLVYQTNVNRYEQERLRLALELHDSVLNELAALLMFLDPSAQTPKFQSAYDVLVQRVRDIVADLRPPMLNYGFRPALAELADHLSEMHNDEVRVIVTVQGNDTIHYPQDVEHHLYRMIQQACENSIRHGKPGHIHILGRLDQDLIDLTIEDDGMGFNTEGANQLEQLASKKHFGLVGMRERAQLIGAEVRFDSLPKKGARVNIRWKPSK